MPQTASALHGGVSLLMNSYAPHRRDSLNLLASMLQMIMHGPTVCSLSGTTSTLNLYSWRSLQPPPPPGSTYSHHHHHHHHHLGLPNHECLSRSLKPCHRSPPHALSCFSCHTLSISPIPPPPPAPAPLKVCFGVSFSPPKV